MTPFLIKYANFISSNYWNCVNLMLTLREISSKPSLSVCKQFLVARMKIAVLFNSTDPCLRFLGEMSCRSNKSSLLGRHKYITAQYELYYNIHVHDCRVLTTCTNLVQYCLHKFSIYMSEQYCIGKSYNSSQNCLHNSSKHMYECTVLLLVYT